MRPPSLSDTPESLRANQAFEESERFDAVESGKGSHSRISETRRLGVLRVSQDELGKLGV
ncbi:MAG TPA: hypothetical protein VI409_00420 [Gaiellaceae bacterium]|nr:hypothetical protein [Gaiellaceae bacterium]